MKIDRTDIVRSLSKQVRYLSLDRRRVYQNLIKLIAPSLEQSKPTLEAVQPFLITSTGRTGTVWLSNILNKIPSTCVVHEPVLDEQKHHVEALINPEAAVDYLRDFRLREMKMRVDDYQPAVYGEVNGALRHHLVALRQVLPKFKILHLVRDGRSVVSSCLIRTVFTPKDQVYQIMQAPAALSSHEWDAMDRFTRLCWLWAYENVYMREQSDSLIRFEDMVSDYAYFKERILDPLNLTLTQDVWESYAKVPLNASTKKQKSQQKKFSYSDWTPEQKNIFWDICGDEMTRYGYLKE